MKSVLSMLFASLLVTTSAFAASSVFITERQDDDVSIEGASLVLSEKGDEALVAVKFVDNVVCRDQPTGYCNPETIEEFPVQGLLLDKDQIVFSKDGGETVCAKLVRKKFLWWHYRALKSTGFCRFRQVRGADKDGFRVHKLFLDVR
ncbi:MAG: hypothetical protein HY075_01565 [Deltaproteobacteria bacterium]|nr:hypothetical protein [Deltaproteobacteria bacterium]